MSTMDISEIKETEWYKGRPELIKKAIDLKPPGLYSLNGKQCFLISYQEPEDGSLLEDITVTVQKTGEGGLLSDLGLGELDTNQVFGVKIKELSVWED